ncbi:MAG TPA: glycosyl hydrolase, partial [Vicinamibacteria bacterium]|nr:glycosyl hydrolase [Vicinamibacteria bacterium]
WTWLHSPSFRASPLDVKAEADLHFLQGINQLIGHGWPYTAEGVAYPGWRFYAAGVFNEKNPWWIVMPDVTRYLQRTSFLLRQGQPANDVALYLPNHDAWAHFTAGRVHMIETLAERLGADVVARVLEAGFNLDFVDDEALARLGRIEKGSLVLGTNRYRAVVLPGVESIPLPTYRKLEELARAGGAVIATRRVPSTAPGLLATAGEQSELRELSGRLFGASSPSAHFVENESRDLSARLAALVRPDVALSPAVPEIGFVHRRTADADIYFLANTSNVRQTVSATFRVKGGARAEWWDPMTGRVSPARSQARAGGGQTVSLELEAYGSRVVVFTEGARASEPVRARGPERVAALPPPIDLSQGWRLSFGPGRPAVPMDRLRSWTEDAETRNFSGLGTYEKDVEVPQDLLGPGLALRLDLGEAQPVAPLAGARQQAWLEAPVREAAVVYVNGSRAGSVWCPPYSVDLTDRLRPGANTLRIEVANLAINHMAGRSLPDYRLLNLRYGTRFEPQDMDKVQPIPAGLLGPIRLVAGRLEGR